MSAKIKAMALAGTVALAAGTAQAQTPPSARADLLQRLSACRGLAEDGARLACFDAATAALDAAEQKGELVVMDRGQIREAKRQAFGLELGQAFKIFDRGGQDDGAAEEVQEVTLTVAQAALTGTGQLVVTATDGQVWRQVDSERVYKAPKTGSAVKIRRASLGSFLMKVEGERAVRAHRDK